MGGPQDQGKARASGRWRIRGRLSERFPGDVESMDAAVGRVLKALEASGRAGDTIIVFTSDNGGERYSYHWPFRGEKGYLWEGGIRVPTDRRVPRACLRPVRSLTSSRWHGLASDAAVGSRGKPDPLIRRMASISCPSPRTCTGVPERTVFWRTQDMMAARKGDWKLRPLGYARVPGEPRRGRDGECKLQAEERSDVRTTQRAYEAWTSRCCRSHTRPDAARGKPGEPRAQPRTCATLVVTLWSPFSARADPEPGNVVILQKPRARYPRVTRAE
jgi:hypothetical protein